MKEKEKRERERGERAAVKKCSCKNNVIKILVTEAY